MSAYFFEQYLAQHRDAGIESRRIDIDRGTLPSIGSSAAQSLGRGARVWVLSDENTEGAAGATVRNSLEASGLEVIGPVLAGTPKPEPTLELCDELTETAADAALVIAVGGGTISDVGKKVSADLAVPNWSVPTAPSVDAFTSAKSALRIRGYHRTPFVRPSEYVCCDLAVLEAAPVRLLQAGVGDLLAKYYSYLDWTLSSWITGEAYDEADAWYAVESARRSVRAVRDAAGTGGAVAERVTDAALTSGLIMQKRRNSRAAASSEHTIAHFWEAAHVISNGELDLHGMLVAAASRLTFEAYRWFFERFPALELDKERLSAEYARKPSWDRQVKPEMEQYRDKMEEEMADRDFSTVAYSNRLRRIEERRDEMLQFGRPVLDELQDAVSLLLGVGFPLGFAALGVDRAKARLSVEYVRFLRNRYSVFDVAADVGLWDELMEYLGGVIEKMD